MKRDQIRLALNLELNEQRRLAAEIRNLPTISLVPVEVLLQEVSAHFRAEQ